MKKNTSRRKQIDHHILFDGLQAIWRSYTLSLCSRCGRRYEMCACWSNLELPFMNMMMLKIIYRVCAVHIVKSHKLSQDATEENIWKGGHMLEFTREFTHSVHGRPKMDPLHFESSAVYCVCKYPNTCYGMTRTVNKRSWLKCMSS